MEHGTTCHQTYMLGCFCHIHIFHETYLGMITATVDHLDTWTSFSHTTCGLEDRQWCYFSVSLNFYLTIRQVV